MSQSQSAPSAPTLARKDSAPADPALVAELKQVAKQANQNCDRAMALAHTLSAHLREAQSRINQLELEADRRADQLWVEAEAAVAKLQSEANARLERTKREADARIARVKGEAESRVRQLEGELAKAQQLTRLAKADARIAHERVACAETEANDRLSRAWADSEDRFIRLKTELAKAELRADRAEQWLVIIRREIEDNLMPSLAPMHVRVSGSELGRARPPTSEASDNAQAA
jgi:hypothetical protein